MANKDNRPTKMKTNGLLGIEQKAQLNATFSISLPANTRLAETLSQLTAGTRSRWIRERLNSFDMMRARMQELEIANHNLEQTCSGWARRYKELQHESGIHTDPEHFARYGCEACADLLGAF